MISLFNINTTFLHITKEVFTPTLTKRISKPNSRKLFGNSKGNKANTFFKGKFPGDGRGGRGVK